VVDLEPTAVAQLGVGPGSGAEGGAGLEAHGIGAEQQRVEAGIDPEQSWGHRGILLGAAREITCV